MNGPTLARILLGEVIAAAVACLLYVWGVDRSGYALAYWPAAVASLKRRPGSRGELP